MPSCHICDSDTTSLTSAPRETGPAPCPHCGNSRGNPEHSAKETSPIPAAGAEHESAPGYFPRLLSAAAYVSLLASDRALERFGLNRNSFVLLEHLASEAAAEGVLASAVGQPPVAVQRNLADLRSSGYAVPGESGTWSVTDAGLRVIECAHLAQAEAALDAEDSRELRQALRSLIASLRLEQQDGEFRP